MRMCTTTARVTATTSRVVTFCGVKRSTTDGTKQTHNKKKQTVKITETTLPVARLQSMVATPPLRRQWNLPVRGGDE